MIYLGLNKEWPMTKFSLGKAQLEIESGLERPKWRGRSKVANHLTWFKLLIHDLPHVSTRVYNGKWIPRRGEIDSP